MNDTNHKEILDDIVPLKKCLLIGGVFLSIALAVSVALFHDGVSKDIYASVQVPLFIQLNDFLSPVEMLWLNLTNLGDAFFLLPLLSFFAFTRPAVWAALFASVPLVTILIRGGKALAEMPRPAAVLDPLSFTIIGEQLNGRNSFPSGHTATVFVAGTVIILVLFFARRHPTRWLMLTGVLGMTTILALSRVAVGAHWPLDVFYGALCGYFSGLSGVALTQHYKAWWRWMTQARYKLLHGGLLIIWAASLLYAMQGEDMAVAPIYVLSAMVAFFSAYKLITNKGNISE